MREPLNCRELLGHEDFPELGLAVTEQQFLNLAAPVNCYFVRLAGNTWRARQHPATLTGLASSQALILSASPLARHSNIILRLEEDSGQDAPELYAKVIRLPEEPDQGYVLHFTSVSPAMQQHLDRLLGK